MELENDRIVMHFYDDGLPFDFSGVPSPDLAAPKEGGYGLWIVRQVMDDLSYAPGTERGNHWRAEKRVKKRTV